MLVPLTFVVTLVWWYWILLNLACLKSFLSLHQFWMKSLLGTVILIVGFFPFSTLYPAIPFWPEEFWLKDQLLSLWDFPCMLLVASHLLLLIFFLSVKSLLVWLVCVLVCFSLGLSCMGLLDLIDYLPFHVGEIFDYNFFETFLIPFLFLFFWDPYNSNVGVLDIVPEVSETVLSSFDSFLFILLFRSYFHKFIFQLTDSPFCFRYSPWLNSFFLLASTLLRLVQWFV